MWWFVHFRVFVDADSPRCGYKRAPLPESGSQAGVGASHGGDKLDLTAITTGRGFQRGLELLLCLVRRGGAGVRRKYIVPRRCAPNAAFEP